MDIRNDFELKSLNTFGISARAEHFVQVHSLAQLSELLSDSRFKNTPKRILGGGSNILITQNIPGLVIHNQIKGIEVVDEDEESWTLKIGAGEVWHELVTTCVHNNFAGVENLSLIPGYVGAAPMQNIGAYGVELKEVFHSLEAMDLEDGVVHTFTKSDCEFGYRESVFKNRFKGQFIICSVSLKLTKSPDYNISYGAIEQELSNMGVQDLSIAHISQAVINIRRSKLPDPKEIGNAGSFFKNPIVTEAQFQAIKSNFPNVVSYPANGNIKLAAGWLIDQAGWKGHTEQSFGVHKKQALVLVNYGEAQGSNIKGLADEIKADINQKFGVDLEMEVNVW